MIYLVICSILLLVCMMEHSPTAYADSDMTQIKPAKTSHNAAQVRLVKRLRAEGCNGLIVGASGCALCSPCKHALGEPCSFPEYQFSCMSAYCIFVKKLTDKCGIEYDCGDGLLAFFGMYAFD